MNKREKQAKIRRRQQFDHLQIAAFQVLFKLRKDEVGVDMAFASAIADTGDHLFRAALEARPEAVKKWVKEFAGKKSFQYNG